MFKNKANRMLEEYTQFCKDAASAGIYKWNFGGDWDFNWYKNSVLYSTH